MKTNKLTLPIERQTELRAAGLLARPDQLWTSPQGSFVLDRLLEDEKRRPRIDLYRIAAA